MTRLTKSNYFVNVKLSSEGMIKNWDPLLYFAKYQNYRNVAMDVHFGNVFCG